MPGRGMPCAATPPPPPLSRDDTSSAGWRTSCPGTRAPRANWRPGELAARRTGGPAPRSPTIPPARGRLGG
ncbi:hypothetical protein K227x_44410 [Rubripirellula lacrimiformis]|uniref:Uncharacterized protein n=1 Tax=Rubripirellula lacrimiformis TaxID=1930273 RepID=A0A517NFX4_9BACT|nr:hypothetical protein K227x_44410 [Rubripirellula lacrimiformis]